MGTQRETGTIISEKNRIKFIVITLVLLACITIFYLADYNSLKSMIEFATDNIKIVIYPILSVFYLLTSKFVSRFYSKKMLKNVDDILAVAAIMARINISNNLVGIKNINESDAAVSLIFLDHKKKEYNKSKFIIIFSIIIFSALITKYELQNLNILLQIQFSYLLFVIIKELVLEYRIKNGSFGNNYQEAKEILFFIAENSDDIDFTDSSGKPRKGLIPEKIAHSPQAQSITEGVTI